jgi:hypothetical protein
MENMSQTSDNEEASDEAIESRYRLEINYRGSFLDEGLEYDDKWRFEREGEDITVEASLNLSYRDKILMSESIEHTIDDSPKILDSFLANAIKNNEKYPNESPLNRNNITYRAVGEEGKAELTINGPALRRMQDNFGEDYWKVKWEGEPQQIYDKLLGWSELEKADIRLEPEWLSEAPDSYVDGLTPKQIQLLNEAIVPAAEKEERDPIDILDTAIDIDSTQVSFHLTKYEDKATMNLTDPTPQKLEEYIELLDPDNIIRTDQEVTFKPSQFDEVVEERRDELYGFDEALDGIEMPGQESEEDEPGLLSSVPGIVNLDGRPFPRSQLEDLRTIVRRHKGVNDN